MNKYCQNSHLIKQAQNLGTVQKRIANSNDDGLTNRRTAGPTNIHICEYVLQCQKKDPKKSGQHFKKIRSAAHLKKKNAEAHRRRVGLNFQYCFINLGKSLNKIAMLKYFST